LGKKNPVNTHENTEEEKPRSSAGLFFCALLAVALYPVLFILGWITLSPIYEKKEAVDLLITLRNGAYHFFSGRLFKSMILHHPPSNTDLRK